MQVDHAQQLQLQSDAEKLQDNDDRQKAQSTFSKPQLHQQRNSQTDTLCEHPITTGTGHVISQGSIDCEQPDRHN
jgi:hypothetical protein